MATVLGVRFLAACSLLAAARGGSLRFLSIAAGMECNFAQETQGRRSVICATWTEQANSSERGASKINPYTGVGREELLGRCCWDGWGYLASPWLDGLGIP